MKIGRLERKLAAALAITDELTIALAASRDLVSKLEKVTTVLNQNVSSWQLTIQRTLDSAHHLGNFKYRGSNTGIMGTVDGALGLIPTDTGRAYLADWEWGPGTIRTYSWKQLDDGVDLARRLFQTGGYAEDIGPDRNIVYPQLAFPSFVGMHYDPDPPRPSLHHAGFLLELDYWEDNSIFDPSRAERRALLETTITRWRTRTKPLVDVLKSIEQFEWKFDDD